MAEKKNIGAKNALLPMPLVLGGTYDAAGRPNLIALAWVGMCCAEPLAIQISVRKSRYSYEALTQRKAFTVNVPSRAQATAADYCGLVSGRSVDKFQRCGLTPIRGTYVDAPLAAECPISIECRLLHVFAVGSHDMFVGEIVASWVDETCLDANGALDPARVDAFASAPGQMYYGLGGPVGKAFDIGKALLRKESGES